MQHRILNIFHLVFSSLFMLGVALTIIIWSSNNILFPDLMHQTPYMIVMSVYIIGFIAIISSFIYDKVVVGKQKLDLNDKTSSTKNASNEVKAHTESIDYNAVSRELDQIINSENSKVVKSEKCLSLICNRLNAGQGILFKMSDAPGEYRLKVHASYAYINNKTYEDGYGVNDGLVGLAVKEDREIELNDIPSDNVKIMSGLGKSAPKTVHLMPIKFKDEMKGVLELSLFAPMSQASLKFLQEQSNKIGSIL